MGVGAGGLAIPSALPEAEADHIVEASGAQYAKLGSACDPGFLRAALIERPCPGLFVPGQCRNARARQPSGVAFPPKNPIAAISVAAHIEAGSAPRGGSSTKIIQKQVRW